MTGLNQVQSGPKKALFLTFIGNEVSDFASKLFKEGFEIEVVNCDDSHNCFNKRNIKHNFRTDAENGDVLASFRKEMASNKRASGIVVMDCENSMSTVGFEANMELR